MNIPQTVKSIEADTKALGFTMASGYEIGALLRSLVASKPSGKFLELGTCTGLASAWMLDGMDVHASLLTVDNDAEAIAIAKKHLSHDARISIKTQDGFDLLEALQGERFDLIFADTWPGKIDKPEMALSLVAEGGFYVIDDLELAWTDEEDLEQPVSDLIKSAWQGQQRLIPLLENHPDFICTTLQWSTGIMICTRTRRS